MSYSATCSYVRCNWNECSEAAECFQLHGPNTASIQLVHEEGLLAHTEHIAGLGPKPAKFFWSIEDMSDFCNIIFIPAPAIIYLVSATFWRKHFTRYLLFIHFYWYYVCLGSPEAFMNYTQPLKLKKSFSNCPKITFWCYPGSCKIHVHCFCMDRKIVLPNWESQTGMPRSVWWARPQCPVPIAGLCCRLV